MESNQSLAPTLKHVHQILVTSHNALQSLLTQICIQPLAQSEDLQANKATIKKVLNSIPSENTLQMYEKASKETMRRVVTHYDGQVGLVRQVASRFHELKAEQKKIYYLVAKSEMGAVAPEFNIGDQNIESISHLHSYKDIVQSKRTRVKILQKNTICDSYLQQGEAQLDIKNQPIVKSSKKTQQLKKFDMLIHINYYDSHNGEKQYEFICVQDQLMSNLVQKFKCVIDTLYTLHKIRGKQSDNQQQQAYQIYDKFYQPQPSAQKPHHQQKSSNCQTRSQNSAQIKEQLLSHMKNGGQQEIPSLKYIIIEDALYYMGPRSQLDSLLNHPQCPKYHPFEMEKTKLSTIRPILGRPYIYRHLGGCDHIIIIKQARLYMGDDGGPVRDIKQIDRYPITVFQSKMKRKRCEGCYHRFADLVVLGSQANNGVNLFQCLQCYQDLHANSVGNSNTTNARDKMKVINYIHD